MEEEKGFKGFVNKFRRKIEEGKDRKHESDMKSLKRKQEKAVQQNILEQERGKIASQRTATARDKISLGKERVDLMKKKQSAMPSMGSPFSSNIMGGGKEPSLYGSMEEAKKPYSKKKHKQRKQRKKKRKKR